MRHSKLEQAARQALEALELHLNGCGVAIATRIAYEALGEALAGDNMSPTEQAEQEPIKSPDKGLWTVKQWGTDKVVLLSGDFTHDVALAISGDFLDIEQRLDYALNLAAWMNQHLQNAAPVQKAEQKPVAVGKVNDQACIDWFEGISDYEAPVGAILYAAPVRTKDLTEDEIIDELNKRKFDWVAVRSTTYIIDSAEIKEFARAVIAADREKNK